MLLAGEATETIASSTTGVAEDVVRIVEDFAGSVSSALSPDDRVKRRVKAKVKIDSIRQKEKDDGADASYVTFGSYAAPSVDKEEEPPAPVSDKWHKMYVDEESLVDVVELGLEEFWKLVAFAMAETQGVPSFAGELLGVIILCYLAAFWVVSSSSKVSYRRPARQDDSIHLPLLASDDDTHISELSDVTRREAIRGIIQVDKIERKHHFKPSCCSWFIGMLFLPFRTFLFLLSMARRTICNKLTLLLVLYGGAWMYLCRASQLRSSAIQR